MDDAITSLKKKLVPEVWKMFKEGKIDFTAASKVAKYGEQKQERQARLFIRKEISLSEL